ncbi:hypothetical protein [Streptomyces sp. NRRL S-920]|uniref:hypothetical protein n=1 Tax=Streptomyces sp. NRRL S-920 TaxID=1463921 RepID=UPI0004CB5C01|nr:hypothetical protein [Streptomyces sp. NRRL S-920]
MYRSLRDSIVTTMADPNDWDGDGDEGSILGNYVAWLAARHTEIQKADAATVRDAKVREPIDEAERYLNAVLEDVAVKIEGGSDA